MKKPLFNEIERKIIYSNVANVFSHDINNYFSQLSYIRNISKGIIGRLLFKLFRDTASTEHEIYSLKRFSIAYYFVKNKGFLTMQEFIQIIDIGIPIHQIFNKKEVMERGVSFEKFDKEIKKYFSVLC